MFSGLNKLRMSLVWMLLITLQAATRDHFSAQASSDDLGSAAWDCPCHICSSILLGLPIIWRAGLQNMCAATHPPWFQIKQHSSWDVVIVIRLVEEHILSVTRLLSWEGHASKLLTMMIGPNGYVR
jgi:hypothetical protein